VKHVHARFVFITTPRFCNRVDERMYFGMLFGGHMGHRANNNRICVDQNRDGDWNDGGNWGAYMYPTIERGNIQQRQNQKTVKCQWCCKP